MDELPFHMFAMDDQVKNLMTQYIIIWFAYLHYKNSFSEKV